MAERFGTEIAFRLGPGRHEQARAVAGRLAAAAAGATRHVLFLNDDGEYGCLAEWRTAEAAGAYGDHPAVRSEMDALAAELGKEPRVRIYAMEEQPPGGRAV